METDKNHMAEGTAAKAAPKTKFDLMQEEAVEWLSKICGCELANTRTDVFLACRRIKKAGSLAQREEAKYWAGQWYWADYEKKYHAQ